MALPQIRPQPLVRIPEPFNDPAWLYEIKLDGFRAFAYVENGECRLISRNGHVYKTFDPLRASLHKELKVKDAILDGEIVWLNDEGRSLFNPLLFRRCSPVFAAFDLVWANGKDLRWVPLIERKKKLRSVLPVESPCVLHVDFSPREGQGAVCARLRKGPGGGGGEVGAGHLPNRWPVNELGEGEERELLAGRGTGGLV